MEESEQDFAALVGDQGNAEIESVFIHSSFRTGSTWFWSKFRERCDCYCYYEVFNEALASIDHESVLQSAETWNSHHPEGPPYFNEFIPLIEPGGGVAGYHEDMAVTEYFLSSSGGDDRSERLRAYLQVLSTLARQNGKVPVLSCTRSIARAKTIKSLVGGTHILLKRSLINQWFSYSNQASNGNTYFIDVLHRSICAGNSDSFVMKIKKYIDDHDGFGLPRMDDDKIIVAFLALHLYIYARYESDFDLIVNLGGSYTKAESDDAEEAIKRFTSLQVDLSDYQEAISAPDKLIGDVANVVSTVRSMFAEEIVGEDDDDFIRKYVDIELSFFQSDYFEYVKVAGSAHSQLEKYKVMQEQMSAARDNAASEVDALSQAMSDLNATYQAAVTKLDSLNQRLGAARSAAKQQTEQCEVLEAQFVELKTLSSALAETLAQEAAH